MNDNDIIQLYWNRNEQAIEATADKYGHYCKAIAKNILDNEEDAEECVNDTYLTHGMLCLLSGLISYRRSSEKLLATYLLTNINITKRKSEMLK